MLRTFAVSILMYSLNIKVTLVLLFVFFKENVASNHIFSFCHIPSLVLKHQTWFYQTLCESSPVNQWKKLPSVGNLGFGLLASESWCDSVQSDLECHSFLGKVWAVRNFSYLWVCGIWKKTTTWTKEWTF